MRVDVKNFVWPRQYLRGVVDPDTISVAAIIPTYKPRSLTLKLIRNLWRWNPNVSVYLVDDATPLEYEARYGVFKTAKDLSTQVKILRTPVNRLKAGAINYAIDWIFKNAKQIPDVILTLDDDVMVASLTIPNLITELMASPILGAVCSQSRVLNKNKNILTRLQGLEYIGFNATRLADEGFYQGPLVMHGMLTAFRTEALREVGGFTENHLIEDYEITARLKKCGWHVKLAFDAPAWTVVPTTLSHLWRQRVRWTYGGITILTKIKYWPAVIQDIIGHAIFLATLGFVGGLVLMKLFGGTQPTAIPSIIPLLIIALSLAHVLIWYILQLWLMRFYFERDTYDWLLRVTLLPEFLYANLLSLVLIGSYFFYLFNALAEKVPPTSLKTMKVLEYTRRVFRRLGYTETWGTRNN